MEFVAVEAVAYGSGGLPVEIFAGDVAHEGVEAIGGVDGDHIVVAGPACGVVGVGVEQEAHPHYVGRRYGVGCGNEEVEVCAVACDFCLDDVVCGSEQGFGSLGFG